MSKLQPLMRSGQAIGRQQRNRKDEFGQCRMPAAAWSGMQNAAPQSWLRGPVGGKD